MDREEVRAMDNQYCLMRDMQFAAYETYARRHGLTAKELFVLDILWFSPEGCLQTDICDRLSATKQTISAISKKFWQMGYLSLTESREDRRHKIMKLTEAGRAYTEKIIPPAAKAEVDALAELDDQDIRELIRITDLFSGKMKEHFEKIRQC